MVRELWRRGFWIGKGTNFGADFLLYNAYPACYHAGQLVVVKEWDEAMSVRALMGLARLATTVRKQAWIATEHEGRVVLLRVGWKGV